jgi:hypothetical protein
MYKVSRHPTAVWHELGSRVIAAWNLLSICRTRPETFGGVSDNSKTPLGGMDALNPVVVPTDHQSLCPLTLSQRRGSITADNLGRATRLRLTTRWLAGIRHVSWDRNTLSRPTHHVGRVLLNDAPVRRRGHRASQPSCRFRSLKIPCLQRFTTAEKFNRRSRPQGSSCPVRQPAGRYVQLGKRDLPARAGHDLRDCIGRPAAIWPRCTAPPRVTRPVPGEHVS